jgi:hypothetical protein
MAAQMRQAMAARFPYEQCEWASNDPAQNQRWYDTLERMGPENVRATLAATGYEVGSRASITIGAHQMTKGFAQEWLAWHDAQKAQRENTFRTNQIYWTRWAALAASGAVLVAVIGWIVTIWWRH